MTALLFVLLLAAQPEWVERFEKLTPAQQQRLLDRMPPERRADFERRLERWRKTSPKERERLRRDLGAMRQLSPSQRERFRETLREIAALPPERRRELRVAIQSLRSLPPDRRKEVLTSERYRQRFSAAELALISSVVELTP